MAILFNLSVSNAVDTAELSKGARLHPAQFIQDTIVHHSKSRDTTSI